MIRGLRYNARVCIIWHRRIVTCDNDHSSDFSAPFLFYIPAPDTGLVNQNQSKSGPPLYKSTKKAFRIWRNVLLLTAMEAFKTKRASAGSKNYIFDLASSTRSLNHRIFRMAGFLQSAPKMSGKFIKIFCSARMEKNTSLLVSFPGFVLVVMRSVI